MKENKVLARTNTPTLSWYDTDRMENHAPQNYSIVGSVFFAAVNDFFRATHTDAQTYAKDLWSKPLIWAQVTWYSYQV
jgi:hypothetical protein